MNICIVVGSKCHGIELPNSDTDILLISNSGEHLTTFDENSGINTFVRPIETVIDWLFKSEKPPWYFTQVMFPVNPDEASSQILKARLPVVYKTLFDRAEGLHYRADRLYGTCPKRMAYSTLLYSILANYAEGMPFAQAHRPEGELHDFLIGMRLGQIPLEDAVARNELERLRAEKAAGFYTEAVHPEILREFEQIIWEEAEKERRNTYA